MSKYYLDLCYFANPFGDIVSYEAGPYDNKLFSTYEEAEDYEVKNNYRLSDNETLLICEMEGEK